MWLILITLEDKDVTNEEDANYALYHRKNSSAFVKEFERVVTLSDSPYASAAKKLMDELMSNIDNRHMAVHGAWVAEGEAFKCEYFKNFGTKSSPDWRSYGRAVSIEDIDAILVSVDDQLRRAIDLWLSILSGRGSSSV